AISQQVHYLHNSQKSDVLLPLLLYEIVLHHSFDIEMQTQKVQKSHHNSSLPVYKSKSLLITFSVIYSEKRKRNSYCTFSCKNTAVDFSESLTNRSFGYYK